MLAEERFSLIMEQLNRKRTVTVQELCEALDDLGMRWRVSYSGGGLAALAAASAAGLGVSLLPASCRLPGHRVLGTAEGLPVVEDFELALFYRDNAPAITLDLAERLITFCGLTR